MSDDLRDQIAAALAPLNVELLEPKERCLARADAVMPLVEKAEASARRHALHDAAAAFDASELDPRGYGLNSQDVAAYLRRMADEPEGGES